MFCTVELKVLNKAVCEPDTKAYRILGNFRGKIILLFLQICLQPQNFTYMCEKGIFSLL